MNSLQAPKTGAIASPARRSSRPRGHSNIQVTYAYDHMRCDPHFHPSPNKYPRLMDEALTRARLAQVEWHISVGERAIARQRDIIAKLRSGGIVTANAEGILRALEQTQAAHIADRDMLLKRLCGASPLASTLSVFLAR
jgi:hypothetical protein